MANLTGYRNAERLGDGPLANFAPSFYLKSGETIYSGSLVFVDNVTGYAYASTGATRVCAGYNVESDLVATSDTSTLITPRRAPVILANSGTSALANKDRGKLVYAEDNQTARLASGAYAPLGCFIGFADDGVSVVVEAGAGFIATAAGYVTSTTTLTNLNALAGTGILVQTGGAAGSATFAERSVAVGSAALVVTNGDGVAGNPSLDGSVALKALSAFAGTGIICQTGGAANNGTFAERSITSTGASISITNPAGVAGDINLENLFACVEVADPGTGAAIPVTKSATVMFTVGAGVETNTLAIPTFVGQTLRLTVGSIAGGSRAVTAASAINVAGNTVMTFNAARDNCELRAVKVGGVLAWEIGFNASVTLS